MTYDLTKLYNSLSSALGPSLINVFSALLLLLVGFLVAGIVKSLVLGAFKRTNIDEKIASKMNANVRIDQTVAKLAYYLVVLFVLLLVLDRLGAGDVLEPLRAMLRNFLGFIPNIVGAGIIGYAGYILSTIASEAVGFIGSKVETFGEKMGFKDPVALTKVLKQLVFVVIFVPILIVALDQLNMKSITVPATNMLNSMMAAIPNIIGAAIIIGLSYVVGRFIVNILTDFLANIGLNDFSKKMGFASIIGDTPASTLVGNVAFFFIMFGGILSAADKLEMSTLSNLLEKAFELTSSVMFGLVIMAIGVFIANKVYEVASANKDNEWFASVAKFAIYGVFGAISLSTMGIADDIVNLAFGLTLGAIAVAFALSFGLGGREAAGKTMEDFLSRFRSK